MTTPVKSSYGNDEMIIYRYEYSPVMSCFTNHDRSIIIYDYYSNMSFGDVTYILRSIKNRDDSTKWVYAKACGCIIVIDDVIVFQPEVENIIEMIVNELAGMFDEQFIIPLL